MTLLASYDATTPSAEDITIDADQCSLMHEVLDALPEREACIVSMRLGLTDDPDSPQTLRAIGEVYGISPARVDQIFKHAMQRLRLAQKRSTHSGDLNRAVRTFLAA